MSSTKTSFGLLFVLLAAVVGSAWLARPGQGQAAVEPVDDYSMLGLFEVRLRIQGCKDKSFKRVTRVVLKQNFVVLEMSEQDEGPASMIVPRDSLLFVKAWRDD